MRVIITFFYIFTFFVLFTETNLIAQMDVTVIDTVFTPEGFYAGKHKAIISIPSESNGIGIILCHGTWGKRFDLQPLADVFNANGYVTMSIDYQDFDEGAKYPKPVSTFKVAVEFLIRNKHRFGITEGKVVGYGKSEGAIHWGQSIIWDNDDDFFQTDPEVYDRLSAVILVAGLYDFEKFQKSSGTPWETYWLKYFSPNLDYLTTKGSTITNVANITTPVFLAHANDDAGIDYHQSIQLNNKLLELGKESRLMQFGGGGHLFDVSYYQVDGVWQDSISKRGHVLIDTVLAWLARTLPGQPPAPPVLVEQKSENINDFKLYPNYPNPFNPATTIELDLPMASNVRLAIYNLLGREVATLVNGHQNAGMHSIQFNASELSSGIYLYRLQIGEQVLTRKMMLVR